MLELVSHEYDAERDIDTFVFNPGNLQTIIRVLDNDGEPTVLLGVAAMTYEQKGAAEPTWTNCSNPEIKKFALEEYEKRKG